MGISERMRASEQAREAAEDALKTAREMLEEKQRDCLRLRAEMSKTEEEREMLEALDGRALEEWPMFEGRRVLRVHDSEAFDGRVSAEFRVKDSGGERGVSFLMGRTFATRQPEVQCVLFDPAVFSEIAAARCWAANRHRLEKRALRVKL